jgi:hypothetical protein
MPAFNFFKKLNGDEKNAKKGGLEGIQFYLKIERYTEKKGCFGGGGKRYPNFSFCIQFLEKIESQFGLKIGTLFSNQLLL